MDTLLTVMLYFNVIHPGTFQCETINQIKANNWSSIQSVEGNPTLMTSLLTEYESEVSEVIIIDTMSGGSCHVDNQPPH